jgi:solute carrier family 50 (sugar transporter)
MLTNTFNGTFWAAYGIAVLNPFIAVPNSLGALLGVIQIVLCFLFPRQSLVKKNEHSASPENEMKNGADEEAS